MKEEEVVSKGQGESPITLEAKEKSLLKGIKKSLDDLASIFHYIDEEKDLNVKEKALLSLRRAYELAKKKYFARVKKGAKWGIVGGQTLAVLMGTLSYALHSVAEDADRNLETAVLPPDFSSDDLAKIENFLSQLRLTSLASAEAATSIQVDVVLLVLVYYFLKSQEQKK